jgi:hypothetical protein
MKWEDNVVSPHRPDRHPEGTDSDLDKILHISSDSQKAKPKFEVVITFQSKDMGLQNLNPRGRHARGFKFFFLWWHSEPQDTDPDPKFFENAGSGSGSL